MGGGEGRIGVWNLVCSNEVAQDEVAVALQGRVGELDVGDLALGCFEGETLAELVGDVVEAEEGFELVHEGGPAVIWGGGGAAEDC